MRFTTRVRLSPLGDGRGYWRYVPTADGVRFITGYDYRPGWGRLLDAAGTRWLLGWMTAWSFDRLRIWAETGQAPQTRPLVCVLAFWRPDRPRAARCLRRPPVTFFVGPILGPLVAGLGMTQAPCRLHDPGGVVA